MRSVAIDADSDPAFSLVQAPETVPPDGDRPLVVAYEATAGMQSATITIVSDAMNVPDGRVQLAVEGTGVE